MPTRFPFSKKTGFSFIFILTAFLSNAQVTSDFSASADGWTVFDNFAGSSVAATYNATGGNPGGYVSFTTSVGYLPLYFTAPAKFTGNISPSYNQNLTFDLKVSTTGTDNTNGDVILSSPGITLYYQLPAKPVTASWSSYSIPLNEASWHYGCYTCAAPNQIDMKRALSNVSKLQIRLKYLSGNTGPYTSQLDNVVLNTPPTNSPPSITSFAPLSALAGSTVTINGSNFNTTLSQNAVYFKGIKATVTNATATQLTVKVPVSATYGPITVANISTGLQGSSIQSFNPLFDNNKDYGGRIIPASMSRGYNSILPMSGTGNGFGGIDKGDLDGDGWIDLVVTETGSTKIYAYQNLGTGGAVSTSSFGSPITLPSLSAIPGGGPSLSQIALVDVDSDGKLDVAASTGGNYNSGTGFLAVYRNTSTPGAISFASPVFFAYNYYNAAYMANGDLDGDGRVDFAFTTGTSPGNVYISQNLSTPGNIDFAYGSSLTFGSTSGYSGLVIGDLTGDGKPEIVAPGYNATTLSIYQNISSPGTISLVTPFTIPAQVSYTVQLAMADLDADSKLDMVWSVYGSQYVYFTRNQYNGSTFDATSFSSTIQVANKLANPNGIAVSDINADGKPDVIMTGSSDLGILQNVGSGALSASSFSSPVLMQGSASAAFIYGVGPAVADFDGDNKPDVALVYTNSAVPTGERGVYLFHNECYPVPNVTSVTPASGFVGSAVSLNGDLMYTGNVSPSVRLNKIISAISGSPTNTLTSVTTPVSGISGNFNITNHGLTSFSPSFNSLFNTNRVINSSSFGPSVDFGLAYGTGDVLGTADFNDDGKTDLAITDSNGTGIFQNTATAGQPITTSSLTKLAATFSAGGNVILSDIDGDGKIDLSSSGISQNISSGTTISFASTVYAAPNPSGAATADFNKDGKVDFAITTGSNAVQVFENRSTRGTFVNNGNLSTFYPTSTSLTHPSSNAFGGNNSLAAADFDGDGYDDLAATSAASNSFVFFRNLGVLSTISNSSFATGVSVSTSSQPYGLTANDFDGDGKIDIAVVHYNSVNVSVYRNTSSPGSISFATPINLTGQTFGYNISSQDLDGDGKPEIVTTRNPNPGTPSFSIFQNSSTSGSLSFGTAVTFTTSRYPQALAFADINSDQKPDILLVAYAGSTAPVTALMVYENKIVTPVIAITSQPISSYAVCDGATPSISTSASGTTNISYQWQIFNPASGGYIDLTNTGGYSNISTSSLTINTTGNFGAGTYRCKVNGDFATTVYTNTVSFTVNALPVAPTASNVNFCPSNTVLLTASGGSNGQYLWYDQNGLINGQSNNTYATPVISATTNYSVAITNGTCFSIQTPVNAIALTVPSAPAASDVNFCPSSTVLLTATGGSNGQYLWYDQNGLINGQVNDTYTTSLISATTFYSVAITNGNCVSAKTTVQAIALTTGCTPPTITPESLSTQIGGTITLNLAPLISTPGSSLDITSLQIITQPSSGAIAAINTDSILTINYTGLSFSGVDSITIKACDLNKICAQQAFAIDVVGDIEVFNGISPNGANPKFIIQYIDAIPETKNNTVYIFDRWENLVWKGTNYDNSSVVFTGNNENGNPLPSGVYFYKIVFASDRPKKTGFISLRRQ